MTRTRLVTVTLAVAPREAAVRPAALAAVKRVYRMVPVGTRVLIK